MNIKVLSEEISLNSADTVSSASLVRIYNNTGSAVLVTRRDDANTVIGSLTLPGNEVTVLEKLPTDTFEASANVLASSVAFTA